MALAPWAVVDTASFEVVAEETRGLRAKQWVRDLSDVKWLRKSPRASRPYEPVIECLAASLASAAGLVAPESHCCTWGRERGVLVRKFGEEDEELVEASALLARTLDEYEPRDHAAHSLTAIAGCLDEWEAKNRDEVTLRVRFAQMLAFDLWVGNGDRHQENWGILTRGPAPEVRMAPVYDTAACLGAELG